MSSLELQPRNALPVYVNVPNGGRLGEVCVKAGDHVVKGQTLARLQNIDLELEIAKLDGERKQRAAQLKNLHREGLQDPQAAAPNSRGRQGAGGHQEATRRRSNGTRSGCVLLAPGRRHRPAPAAHHRTRGPGRPVAHLVGHAAGPGESGRLSERKRRCSARSATPQKLEAIMVIDQRDIEDVKTDLNQQRKVRSTSSSTRCRTTPCTADITELAQSRIEDHSAAAVDKDGRGTGDHDRSALRRGASAEHVLSGPRAAGQPRQPHAAGPSRPGEDPRRLAPAGHAALAAARAHLQLQAVAGRGTPAPLLTSACVKGTVPFSLTRKLGQSPDSGLSGNPKNSPVGVA